jgi:hypothetical protein
MPHEAPGSELPRNIKARTWHARAAEPPASAPRVSFLALSPKRRRYAIE